MTTQFDISSLSIPLLLLPDRYMDQPDPLVNDHAQWLQKRGEVVMKCIKGFLIENSRSGKRVQNEGLDRAESMASGGMRNIEFLLPSLPEVYATPTPNTPSTATNATNATTVAGGQINPNTSSAAAVTAATIAAVAATSTATSGSNRGSFSGSLPDLPSTPITATPQEVELAFQQFRTQLVSLFRAN
ncbi:MAG: DUF2362 domain-containing protein [Leuconostoc mesenteroides]